MDKDTKKFDDIIRRLDIISVLLLAQKGLSQNEIGKILGISPHKIQDIFGNNYAKIQSPEKKSED